MMANVIELPRGSSGSPSRQHGLIMCVTSDWVGSGVGLGEGDVEGESEGCVAGPLPDLGSRLMPTNATATTATVATRTLARVFMSENLHAGHENRRCRVAG